MANEIQVTKKEKRLLEWIVSEMYAEMGFSDINYTDVSDAGFDLTTYRGVISSLIKKELITVDDEWDNMIYLTVKTQGMVTSWLEEGAENPVILIIK